MQQARAAGCRTAEEANRFIEEKRRKEAEESALRIKESLQAGPSGKGLPKPSNAKGEVDASSPRGLTRGSTSLSVKDSTLTTGPIASSLDDWDIAGLIGSELLSETVRSSLLNFKYVIVNMSLTNAYTKGSKYMCRRNSFAWRSEFYLHII